MKMREITRTTQGQKTMDGAGVHLIRVLGHNDVKDIDPFLMLDAFDSANPADYVAGFPMHPHRGIETITYLVEGTIKHKDSLGNGGVIHSGEAQWMTAGRGILHEEMPQPSPKMFGLQIWLNLPAKDKMTAPVYFDITKDMIKTVPLPEGEVRVLSGEFNGAKGVEPHNVKATVLDVLLHPEQELSIPSNPGENLFVYVMDGEAVFGTQSPRAVPKRTAAFSTEGEALAVRSGTAGARFMVFCGPPLREPIAWMGPIVMNTQKELDAAFTQLRYGMFIAEEDARRRRALWAKSLEDVYLQPYQKEHENVRRKSN